MEVWAVIGAYLIPPFFQGAILATAKLVQDDSRKRIVMCATCERPRNEGTEGEVLGDFVKDVL